MICSKISKIIRDRTSPVLLKGKTEGGKQAIAWRLFPNPTSAILLKGNFERGEKAIAWQLIQCDRL
ncbi:hypothetical protein B7O87_05035 [Cylindrospermopsis raciborskii CENA303]|uniref:Uncharacterized protein n=1 Tax=Cylindrospermopsis raciborskii CENA303 TaxID=1170769 RepID=A0A1X4GA09_9CYAN|nr:hypothetical protein [Cylindrospermopsis raciborskii]OSO93917.1 hypothetical protein B7O87_05035 [Cylindrospermopsis raciborskii CENA303]